MSEIENVYDALDRSHKDLQEQLKKNHELFQQLVKSSETLDARMKDLWKDHEERLTRLENNLQHLTELIEEE
jgi:hypothetical protein